MPARAEETRKPVFSYKDASGTEQMPDFAAHTLTAVHFWATWCKPCVAEVPEVDLAQKTYASKGFKVLAISMDGNIDKVKAFYEKHGITALTPMLDNGAISYNALKIPGLPVTVFFNRDGKEIARVEGPMHWNDSKNKQFIESQLAP